VSTGQKAIVAGLAKAAKQYGFRNVRGTNYYLGRPETVCVVNLQKSRWGSQYYLNAGIWLTRFGMVERPPEYKCQIRWRVTSLMPREPAMLFEEALDLENSMPETTRASLIEEGAGAYGFRLLKRCDSEEAALQIQSEYGPMVELWMRAGAQQKAN
jgi:hypothetical protein